MSKAAKKQLTGMVSNDGGELKLDEAVDALVDQQGIQDVTARTYVQDYCETDTNEFGDRVVVGMKEDGESPTPDRGDDVDRFSEIVRIDTPVGTPTGDKYKGWLDVLEDVDHPLQQEPMAGYFERELEGGVTDLETISFDMSDPEFNLLLVGHTGTGKNAAINEVCANTNRASVRVNYGLETTKEKVVGMWVPERNGNGWEWRDGLLTWCVRYGGTYIADEFNGAGGEATMPLHGLLESEGTRYLSIEELGEVLRDLPVTDEEVQDAADRHDFVLPEEKSRAAHAARVEKWDDDEHLGSYIHPEFRFTATINPSSYAGTQDMNDATQNRFYKEWMPYMEWDAEVRVLTQRTPLSKSEAESVVKVANRIRARLAGARSAIPAGTQRKLGAQGNEGGDIYSPISTRDLLKVGRQTNLMSADAATKKIFKNAANPEDVSAIEGIIGKVM